MKIIKKSMFGLLAGLAVVTTSISAQAAELTIATWLPPTHPMSVIGMPKLAEMIDDATGGSVTATVKSGLGAPPAMLDFVQDGIIDIAFIVNGYTPGRFAATKLIELPGIVGSSEAVGVAYWRAHEKYLAKINEHEGVKVIGLFVHGPGQLHVSKNITDLASLNGKKLRVGGGVVRQVATELGIVGVAAPATKVYEYLSSGVADGVTFPMIERKYLRVDEVTDQVISIPGGLYRTAFSIIMNQDKYDSLSDTEKSQLNNVFGEKLSGMVSATWDLGDMQGLEATKASGKPILEYSDADKATLQTVFKKVSQDVFDEVAVKDIDGAEVVTYIKQQISEYNKSK